MKVTICFMTGRAEPHLDWVLDGLASQVDPSDEIDLIVVDALAWDPSPRNVLSDRESAILPRIVCQGLSVRVTPPKPTIWQGRHRVTSCDWWATASARNTALVLARHDYIAFLDDRSRIGPAWLETVRKAERDRASVVCGSYDKLEGTLDAPRTASDHRREMSPSGKINCGGQWLYGCTFCLPLAWALEVNGLEEGCDGLTGEDYIFGLMLGNAGRRIDFSTSLYVYQDRTVGNQSCKGSYACMDKGRSPNDKSHAALKRFGRRTRTEFTPDLTLLRQLFEVGAAFPIPDPNGDHRDWYDDQPIAEMRKTP